MLLSLIASTVHLVTAYDICRHKGVPLGKKDYLAWFMAPFENTLMIHAMEDMNGGMKQVEKNGD